MQWVSIAYCCCYLDDINFAWVGCVILHVTGFSPMFMCLDLPTHGFWRQMVTDQYRCSLLQSPQQGLCCCVLLSHFAIHEFMHV